MVEDVREEELEKEEVEPPPRRRSRPSLRNIAKLARDHRNIY